MHGHRVQPRVHGQEVLQGLDGQAVRDQGRPLALQVWQLGCRMLGQQLDERAAGCPARVPAWAPTQPRAGQLQLAEQGAEDDGLVIFEATASAAGWAGRARGQERGDLAAEDLALELQQERLGLGQRQAQVLRPVVLLVQHNELVDGDLLVVLGDDHELKLEAQRHAGDPQRWKDPATVSARARQQSTATSSQLGAQPQAGSGRRASWTQRVASAPHH